MAQISIDPTDGGELVAPAGVWFEATNLNGFDVPEGETFDRSFHEITYFWNFDDISNNGAFDAPLNIPTEWNDRNTATGKRVCHVFREAKAYNVTVTAYDRSGAVGTASATINVGDPNQIYLNNRTICFDAGGNFAEAPSGAQQVTSVSALQSAVQGLPATGRVLFRRGSDHSNFSFVCSGGPNIRFGAFGTDPARPILRPPRNGVCFRIGQGLSTLRDRVFESLDIRGSWDPTREVGGHNDKFLDMLLSDAPDMLTTVHDCRISGLSSVNLSTLKPVPFTSIISDTVISDWGNIGIYTNSQADGINDNSRHGMLGVAVQQHPDACNGPKGAFIGVGNQLGPVRYETVRKWNMRSCYLFSNTSWGIGSQPCLRNATNNQGGHSAVFDRIVCEGGTAVASNDVSGSGTNAPANMVYDKMLLLATADLKEGWVIDYGGHSWRNILFWMPNVNRYDAPVAFWRSVALSQGASAVERNAALRLYNVSGIYLDDSQNMPLTLDLDDFTNVIIENEIFHAPNQPTPEVGAIQALTTATVQGVQPRYAGRRASIGRPQASVGSIPNGGTITFAYPTGQDGSTPLSGGDFSPSGRHWMKNLSSGEFFYQEDGDFSISFGSSITVQNTSGSAWSGGDFYLICDYLNYTTETAGRASPSTVPLPLPLGTATAGGSNIALDDFRLARRPGLPAAGSPVGTPSKGSVEP